MRFYMLIGLFLLSVCKTEEDGRSLARSHCSSCHLFPEADLLRKQDWHDVLDVMGIYLGYDDAGLLTGTPSAAKLMDRQAMFDRRLIPEKPALSSVDWQKIRAYYRENAPASFTPARTEKLETAHLFRAIAAEKAGPESLFFLVRSHKERIYAADARAGILYLFSNSGKLIRSDPLPGLAVDVQFTDERFFLTLLGSWKTENTREGKILEARLHGGQLFLRPVLTNLYRVPSAQLIDLNGDGRAEILTAQFGHQLGHLSYFENRSSPDEKENWEEEVLLPLPGTVRARAVDLGDGSLSIVALVAQAREGLYVFRKTWRGWDKQVIVEQPPVFGYTDFQLGDFDGDGRLDILTVNGDNAEILSVPPKPYHGLRLYLNRSTGFEEAFFLPLNGAYRATLADFDGDGDLDIAATAFFADFGSRPPQNAVLFLNESRQNRFSFSRHLIAGTECGRWVSLDAADLDGDGRMDLILGGADVPGMPARGIAEWRKRCRIQSLLILRNQARARFLENRKAPLATLPLAKHRAL
ncbi:MAG: VCBS repeat-containing protein [Spirochaetales bacterium]|nr:VCBS repeat-containing protein [Spirochaetales bacterium]